MQQVITCSGVERLRMQKEQIMGKRKRPLAIACLARIFTEVEEDIRDDIGTDRPSLARMRQAIAWLEAGDAGDAWTTESEIRRLKRLWRGAARDRLVFELKLIMDDRNAWPTTVDPPLVKLVAALMLEKITGEASSHLARNE